MIDSLSNSNLSRIFVNNNLCSNKQRKSVQDKKFAKETKELLIYLAENLKISSVTQRKQQ